MKIARTDPTTKLLAELKSDPSSPEPSNRTTLWATPISPSETPRELPLSSST